MLAKKLPSLFSNIENTHQVQLENGNILISSTDLTVLISDDSLIQTWPTNKWLYIGLTKDESKAIFEADDSWLLAILDLETGSWKADDDPLFIQYSIGQDDNGDFILEEITGNKIYLK